MISSIHSKLGTASFIISIVALVAALGGGAYAANSALSGKQKKEVEKIAKKYAGKPGVAGANGDNGAAGATGVGTEGKQGPEGKQGLPGTTGFTEALPAGKTETGAWVWGPVPEGVATAKVALSLAIPLSTGTELEFHAVEFEESPTPECPGSAEEPEAAPGNLCLYVGEGTGTFTSVGALNPQFTEVPGTVGSSGVIVSFFGVEEGESGRGVWAATAP
jgi:hypothetical protein